MLKLSNKIIYGIKALYELSRSHGSGPLSIRAISEKQGLPVPFLEQVFHTLKTDGLVISRRGVNGGYVLSRAPEDISIGDAVRALEGPIALCDCLQHSDKDDVVDKIKNCVTSDIYRQLGSVIENAFDSISLSELAVDPNGIVNAGTCSKERIEI